MLLVPGESYPSVCGNWGHLRCWLRTSCSRRDSAAGQGWPGARAWVTIRARSPLPLGCRSHEALEGGEGAFILRTQPPPSQPRVARDPLGPALPCDLGWGGGPLPSRGRFSLCKLPLEMDIFFHSFLLVASASGPRAAGPTVACRGRQGSRAGGH